MDVYLIADTVTQGIGINLICTVLASSFLFFRSQFRTSGILIYLFISLLFELSGFLMEPVNGLNHYLIPVFGLFEFGLLTAMLFKADSQIRRYVRLSGILLLVYAGAEAYSLFGGNGFLQIPARSVSYLLIMMSMIAGFVLKRVEGAGVLYSGVLVYASFNCIYFLLLSFSIYWDDDAKFLLWLSHSVLLHIFYPFLLYCQWKTGKSRQPFLFG